MFMGQNKSRQLPVVFQALSRDLVVEEAVVEWVVKDGGGVEVIFFCA